MDGEKLLRSVTVVLHCKDEAKVKDILSTLCVCCPTGSVSDFIQAFCSMVRAKLVADKSITDPILQDGLAMSFVRFLNAIISPNRRLNSRMGKTLYQRASLLGIPHWIIDIRHDVSHGATVPAVERILFAVEWLLEWSRSDIGLHAYRDILSSPNTVNMRPGRLEDIARKDLQNLMHKYIARCSVVYKTRQSSCLGDSEDCRDSLKYLLQALDENWKDTCRLLCCDGYLIPSYPLMRRCKMTSHDFENEPPRKLIKMWEPILYELSDRDNFLIIMLNQLTFKAATPTKQRVLLAWCRYLIDRFADMYSGRTLASYSLTLIKKYEVLGDPLAYELSLLITEFLATHVHIESATAVDQSRSNNSTETFSECGEEAIWMPATDMEMCMLLDGDNEGVPLDVLLEDKCSASDEFQTSHLPDRLPIHSLTEETEMFALFEPITELSFESTKALSKRIELL